MERPTPSPVPSAVRLPVHDTGLLEKFPRAGDVIAGILSGTADVGSLLKRGDNFTFPVCVCWRRDRQYVERECRRR